MARFLQRKCQGERGAAWDRPSALFWDGLQFGKQISPQLLILTEIYEFLRLRVSQILA